MLPRWRTSIMWAGRRDAPALAYLQGARPDRPCETNATDAQVGGGAGPCGLVCKAVGVLYNTEPPAAKHLCKALIYMLFFDVAQRLLISWH